MAISQYDDPVKSSMDLIQLLTRLRTAAIAILAPTRFWDWWEYKAPAFLGVACLAATAAGIGFEDVWPRLLVVVAALIPVASYVSVINEITDRQDDQLAGKPNCMIGRSLPYRASWVVVCIGGGIFALMALRRSEWAAGLYVANWLAFTLYSVPPARLKRRGAWGVVADACGGQMLPTLWTAAFVSHGGETSVPRVLWVALGVWAFFLGCRGILGHQVRDVAADRAAGVRTLAVQLGPDRCRWVMRAVLLPVELAAFFLAAGLSGAWAVMIVFAAAITLSWAWQRCGSPGAGACDDGAFACASYLTAFPLAGALQLAFRSSAALVLVPLQIAAFPGCWGLSIARLASARGGSRRRPAAADAPALPDGSVSVVIPVYRGGKTIGACLESLAGQTAVGKLEVVVVESAGDGTADMIARDFPWVTVVREPNRLSVGAARNRGAALARGEYILFIDQDCKAPSDWASRLVRHVREAGVDAVGGSIGIADPGNLSGAAVYFIEFLHHFPRPGPPDGAPPFLLGCNAGYRAEVLRGVRFPDRTLAEDVLFTERVRAAGFGVMYDPEITVLHHNRTGWGEFFAYARKMGRASAEYHSALDRPWARPFLRWPVLVLPASLAVSPLIGWRLLRAPWRYLGLFVLVAPACVLGNVAWAVAFRRRALQMRPPVTPRYGRLGTMLRRTPRRLAVTSGAPLVDLSRGPSRPDAHELYRRARSLGPVCLNAAQPEWMAVSYDSAVWALKNVQVLSSRCVGDFDPLVVGNDPPGHAAYRKLLSRALGTIDAAMVESYTARWVEEFLHRARARGGTFDVVSDLGCPLPESFTALTLGVNEEETRQLTALRPGNRTRLNDSWVGVTACLHGIVARARTEHRSGVLGALLSVAEPQQLSDAEIVGLARLVWFAGTSTSTHFLPSLLLMMLTHPEALEEVRANRSLVPAFVNEALRMEGPTGVLPRIALADFDFMGVRIPAGAMVKVCLLAANRDAAVFPDPDRVRFDRPNVSLAFGHGIHFCLGAMLARTMAVTVADAFVDSCPAMRAAQPLNSVRYESSEVFRSLKSLRIALA